jgi:hypothetical protein
VLQRVTVQGDPLCFVKTNALHVSSRSPLSCALLVRQLLRHIHEACSVNNSTQACPLFCLSTGKWHKRIKTTVGNAACSILCCSGNYVYQWLLG